VKKQLQLLQGLLPPASVIGVLINPNNPNTTFDTEKTRAAGGRFGCRSILSISPPSAISTSPSMILPALASPGSKCYTGSAKISASISACFSRPGSLETAK
jgi:hypothetical protein